MGRRNKLNKYRMVSGYQPLLPFQQRKICKVRVYPIALQLRGS